MTLAAKGQEVVTYSWSFVEYAAGTGEPSTSPNGIIEPGEEARVRLTATIAPGIGSPATFVPPPAPGAGTIAGLGSIFFDLMQSDARGGSWTFLSRASGWALGSAGTANQDGTVSGAQAGQFVLPGSVANSSNPVQFIWRGAWTPSRYEPRVVTFTPIPAAASEGRHSSILIQYGVDPNDYPLYIPKYVDAVFGSIQIPIVPGPGVFAVIAVGWAAVGRRGRR